MAYKLTEMAKFAHDHGLINSHTIRFFKIAYPILRVTVDIRTLRDNREYHLIEDYLHRLIAGQPSTATAPKKNAKPVSYVEDKQTAFRLLGIDGLAYDVADGFYKDLVLSGVVTETETGLLACPLAERPQTTRRATAGQNRTRLIADPFSMELCHKDLRKYSPRTADQVSQDNRNGICFMAPPAWCYQPEMLERLLNERNFARSHGTDQLHAQWLADRELPAGTQGIEVVADGTTPPVEVLYFTYYLALEEEDGKVSWHLYHMGNGKPIGDFAIEDDEHGYFRQVVESLAKRTYHKNMTFNLTPNVRIPLRDDRGRLLETVTETSQGVYSLALTEAQLRLLVTEGEDQNDAVLTALSLLEKEQAFVFGDLEAGRLVTFTLTQAQKQLCRDILSRPADRIALAQACLQPKEEPETEV